MVESREEIEGLAIKLAMSIKRLRSRLREESSRHSKGLTLSQMAILQRLFLDGPTTAAALAAAEHVSQQAIAQSVDLLKSEGYVLASPDPHDRRKTLIQLGESGAKLREEIVASRNAWLVTSLETGLDPNELADLDRLASLLDKLADAPI